MKRFFATIALFVALTASAFAGTLATYTSPKSDFTIQTPATFVVENKTEQDSSGQPVSVSTYVAVEDNGNRLGILTKTFQYLVSPEVVKAALLSAVKAQAKPDGGVRGGEYGDGYFVVFETETGRAAILAVSKGSELFIVVFSAPQANVDAAGDEVKGIFSSFSTTVSSASN